MHTLIINNRSEKYLIVFHLCPICCIIHPLLWGNVAIWLNVLYLRCCCGIRAVQDGAGSTRPCRPAVAFGRAFDLRVMSFPEHLEINYPCEPVVAQRDHSCVYVCACLCVNNSEKGNTHWFTRGYWRHFYSISKRCEIEDLITPDTQNRNKQWRVCSESIMPETTVSGYYNELAYIILMFPIVVTFPQIKEKHIYPVPDA